MSKKFKAILPRLLVSLACVLLLAGHAGRLWNIPVVTLLDNYFYDVRTRILMPNKIDERIVIVDIDEKSLAQVGHWPWGRNKVADMLLALTDHYGVAVVGFDIVFAEPDGSSGLAMFESIGKRELSNDRAYQDTLKKIRPQLDFDQILADTLCGRPIVLGYYFSNQSDAQQGGSLPPPSFAPGQFAGYPEQFLNWKGYGGNIPVLQGAASAAGHFNPMVDFDGSTRRIPMLVEYDGAYFESLSLAVVRTLLGGAELSAQAPAPDAPVEWLDVTAQQGVISIPVDGDAAALVPYRGRERSFRYVSAVDVLERRVAPDSLAGRIVLIGTTAPGLNDLRTTPVGSSYPGVEIHANMISGMLDGEIKEKPSYILAADVIGVLLAGSLLAFALPYLSPLKGGLLMGSFAAASLGFNLFMWDAGNIVLPYASIALALLLVYGINTSWGYFAETKLKRQFTDLFGQYVPPELVQEMAKNPGNYSMEGRNVELSVLFSDVRSFTTISEGLNPKELTHLMNEYLGGMTSVIRQHRGTLDKYIGDAIMAFWGAPVEDANHAQHAVLAALEMQKNLRQLDEPFQKRGWPRLEIGVGINTGVMTVGDMGSTVRKAYTVMGDAVNLGARLEGITKEYGVGILVGELTSQQCPDIAFKEIDRVRVKGKEAPVTIFTPLGLADELPPGMQQETDAWHQALQHYRAQQWDAAETAIRQLQAGQPGSKLYALYLERIETLRAAPPPGVQWDGVTTFKTK